MFALCARQTEPGMEGRLHRHLTEGGSERSVIRMCCCDGGSARPRPRAHQSERRLLAVGGRGKPVAARDARCHTPHRWTAPKCSLSDLPGGQKPPAGRNHRATPRRHHIRRSPNPTAAAYTSRLRPPNIARINPQTPIYTSLLGPFVRLGRTIRKHREGILAARRLNLSNARAEALNNKAKLIVRRAYGFHSARAALALILLACGPVTLTLPHDRFAG